MKNTELSREIEERSRKFDAVIALGKNWRLPIGKDNTHPLGGSPQIDLSIESKMTALAAGQMYVDGCTNKIIFSTGQTAGKDKQGNYYPTEAEEMKRFMRIFFPENEIPESAIETQTKSFDTAGDAEEDKKILEREDIKNVALLSVGSHLWRSKRLFENYGVRIKKAIASQDILKGRNPHYDKLIQDYFWSTRHLKEIIKETIGVGLVYTIDPKGERLRKATIKTRNRTNSQF